MRDDDTVMDLDDLDACVGREALLHFGDYEEDRVCVRSELFNRDYEIIAFEQKYADFLKGTNQAGK